MSSSLPKAWRANEGGRLGWGTVPSGHNVSGIIVGDINEVHQARWRNWKHRKAGIKKQPCNDNDQKHKKEVCCIGGGWIACSLRSANPRRANLFER